MKYALYVLVAVLAVAAGVCWQWTYTPPPATVPVFRLPIDDAFDFKNPGKVVVVGTIAEGEVRPGDHLKIKGHSGEISVEVEAMEAFGIPLSVGQAGKTVGIKLIGAMKEQVGKDAVLVR
jgi:translation elongation factor EF-Tu-like GTPase